MTPTLHAPRSDMPTLSPRLRVRLVRAAPELWRVVEDHGQVRGHLQLRPTVAGARYCARLFHAPSRSFHDLGEFWSVDDAVECLLFAR